MSKITDAEIDARLDALHRNMVASGQHNGGMVGVAWNRAVYRDASLGKQSQAAALEAAFAQGEGAPLWRDHNSAIDAKALATATEIALMWGQDRSQFVSRIQVAVIDAMQWMKAAQPAPQSEPAAAGERVLAKFDEAIAAQGGE